MARAKGPLWPCAEERRARGGQGHCKMPLLQALTCRRCLSGVNEVNTASSTAPPLARAPQVARSVAQGHGQWGRLFLGYFLSAGHPGAGHPVVTQKKVTAPPGAIPASDLKSNSRRSLQAQGEIIRVGMNAHPARAANTQTPRKPSPQPGGPPAKTSKGMALTPASAPSASCAGSDRR